MLGAAQQGNALSEKMDAHTLFSCALPGADWCRHREGLSAVCAGLPSAAIAALKVGRTSAIACFIDSSHGSEVIGDAVRKIVDSAVR